MKRTYFVDIDGVIFKNHGSGPSAQWYGPATLLPGVREAFRVWEADGAKIILCTGRRESCRYQTVRQLADAGIFYDQLIMGLPRGPRVMINDQKDEIQIETALGYTVTRNANLTEEIAQCEQE